MVLFTRLSAGYLRISLLLLTGWLVSAQAEAQLRIVTYNTTGSPDAGMDIVLRSIGEHSVNGIAKPIDILLLQEQNNSSPGANSPSSNTQAFVSLLNNIYSSQGITYGMSNRTGFGDSTQTLVYRTDTVQLIADTTVGTTSIFGQPRQALRYQLRPVGYDASADFYIYNSHYKASQVTSEPDAPTRRNVEAVAIRNDADALGEGKHIIYAGDFNFYNYTLAVEPAFQTLIASGPGQAHDPINQIGTWHNNSSFAAVHTQSPCNSGCGAGGGMDDRFDFQLVTGEFLDGGGLSYISGSYHAFGNNGSTFNGSINSGNSVTFPGVTSDTKTQILNALATVTDHIPVVADYQVPAIMQHLAGAIPATLNLGQSFQLDVTVSNAANVVAAIGADLLNYSLTSSGDVAGSYLNQTRAALSAGLTHLVTFDTSTPGLKSGMITLSSGSQQVANGFIQIPVSYEVVRSGPQPQVIAHWTFEAGTSGNPPSGSGSVISGISAATGSGTTAGFHASASTVWDNPVGNGSTESLSSNNWATGDYYQFQISTTGLSDISLTLDHASSNTGPKEWGIFYSTTVTDEFTDTGLTYSALANASPNPSWNSSTYLSQYFHSFDLSGIEDLNDQQTLFLRLVSISNVSANGGTVAAGGTSRIDNVKIFGTPIGDPPGDFNHDGIVDAADYVIWRKTGGDSMQYNTWRTHFGTNSGDGGDAISAVPEPSAWLLLAAGICLAGMRRGRLTAWTRQP